MQERQVADTHTHLSHVVVSLRLFCHFGVLYKIALHRAVSLLWCVHSGESDRYCEHAVRGQAFAL